MIDVKNGDLSEWAKKPFSNQDEIAEAMSDSRYKSPLSSDAFRNAVMAKIALPDSAQAGHIVNIERRNFVHVASSASIDAAGIAAGMTAKGATSTALTADEIQAATDEARATWGKSAFEPGSARITPKAAE